MFMNRLLKEVEKRGIIDVAKTEDAGQQVYLVDTTHSETKGTSQVP